VGFFLKMSGAKFRRPPVSGYKIAVKARSGFGPDVLPRQGGIGEAACYIYCLLLFGSSIKLIK